MKRRQLFEFEDQAWFPAWIRLLMTRYIAAFHRLLATGPEVAGLAARALRHVGRLRITDLGSGHGGPWPEALAALRQEPGLEEAQLTLSDLYPDPVVAAAFNEGGQGIRYLTHSVDAASPGAVEPGLRSLVCSFHHMPPEVARAILESAASARDPLLVYEISDNSSPRALWWTALPIGFLLVLFVTLRVRPLTWRQVVFTYLIPILPALIAWDGAVSNARTYAREDLEALIAEVPVSAYRWEIGALGQGPAKRLYLLGLPEG